MTSDTSVGGPCVEHQFVLRREGEGGGDQKRREVGVMTRLCGACAEHVHIIKHSAMPACITLHHTHHSHRARRRTSGFQMSTTQ